MNNYCKKCQGAGCEYCGDTGEELKNHKVVKVSQLPECDFCGLPANFDGRTKRGAWANMCIDHFIEAGVGLGLGKGQRLILQKKEAK